MQDALLAEAVIGKDAEEFLASELGRVILGRVEQELYEADQALRTADPEDSKKIRDLQNQAWRAQTFTSWLGELIVSGQQALETLDQQE